MGSHSTQKTIADLEIVSLNGLAEKDDAEIRKLLRASSTAGMFYLDLRGPSTEGTFGDIAEIFKTAERFFNLPQESLEKNEILHTGLERGYHAGKGFQYYEIPHIDFRSGSWELPKTLEVQRDSIARTLQSFSDAAQAILWELCAAAKINLPELDMNVNTTKSSDTALKIVFKPPIHDAGTVIHPGHTDSGLITLLWYDEETTQIQILDAEGNGTDDWATVPVVEGCVLVNMADSLASSLEGFAHSTSHRVVAPPGEKRTRNGIMYLLRPYGT
ncbi:oxidoreductase [Periconia macrospinosa]|uniref:Oxidoreductase n=1 Tax=Periconia macrospinosa TaxID=97972 RepID=A0A2V1DLB6_9PLEO|nr:oxidoreductase [Periconia macrospinosa]